MDGIVRGMNPTRKHLLKREIKYYSRRSVKEMDALVARFLEDHLETLDEKLLMQLRDVLLWPDEPIRYVLEGIEESPPEFEEIFNTLKTAQQKWRQTA